MNRKEVADSLKIAFAKYLYKKGFSSHFELSVNNKGDRLRADVIANTIRGTIVIGETKSCYSDLVTDKKYTNYLEYCDRFYLIVTHSTYLVMQKKNYALDKRMYLLVQATNGLLKVKKRGKQLPFEILQRLTVLSRMAWRSGEYSKATHSKKGNLKRK
jgi:hypothetical protein